MVLPVMLKPQMTESPDCGPEGSLAEYQHHHTQTRWMEFFLLSCKSRSSASLFASKKNTPDFAGGISVTVCNTDHSCHASSVPESADTPEATATAPKS